MKLKTLICLSVASLICTSAHAWVGGPFSNNSFDNTGNMDGTYQAVLRGQNFVGIMIFGSSATQQYSNTGLSQFTTSGSTTIYTQLYKLTGNEGRFAMFINGTIVVGSATGSVDLSGKSISAVLEGSRNRGQQTITKNITSTSSDGVVTFKTKNYLLKDVLYVSGNFDAGFSRSYPVQSFRGSGELNIKDPTGGVEELQLAAGANDYPDGSSDTSVYTSVVPEIDETTVDLNVYGVKTSNQAPFFGNALTVETPSLTPLN